MINQYLEPTKLCDCQNKQVKEKVSDIMKGTKTLKEAAREIFYFVRDEILFNATLDIFRKASSTLKDGTVDYCNKINLHVALLRAAGIPARLRFVRMRKDILEHFLPKFLYNHIPNPVGHFWCECYLNKKWVSCEALFDETLFRGMKEMSIVTDKEISTIDWDGETNLILLRSWITQEENVFPSFDDLLREEIQKSGMPPKIFCKLFNWLAVLGTRRITNRIRGT
ncbi:MAG: transglutaminase-like domain-containing protein [Promethearchaeota archaeon]